MTSEKATNKSRKRLCKIIFAVILAAGIFIFIKYYFVLGTGVKAGILNQVVYKGYIFKTYEGKLIQSGYRSSVKGGAQAVVQSYEFDFSIVDESLAETLMLSGGKNVELRYKEYLGAAPWRGYSKYVVYGIVNLSE